MLQLNVYSLAIIFLLFENISVCLFFLCGSEEIQSMLEQGFLRHGDNLVVRWIPHYSHDLSHFHLLSCTFISSQRWKLKQYSCMLKILKKKKTCLKTLVNLNWQHEHVLMKGCLKLPASHSYTKIL